MVNIVLAINTDDFFLMIRTFPRGFMDQGGIRLSLCPNCQMPFFSGIWC
jgi:hypothetical protein